MPDQDLKVTLDSIIKIATAIVSAATLFFGAYQWSTMRKRTKLKADLELLKLLREADKMGQEAIAHASPQCDRIRQRINQRITKAYHDPDDLRTDLDRSDLFIGAVLITAGVLAIAFKKDFSTWQTAIVVLGCCLMVGGAIGIYKGFERPGKHLVRKVRARNAKA